MRRATSRWMGNGFSLLLTIFIRCYQILLSPLLYLLFPGLGCRFLPTCSEYARECIVLYGPWKGIYLALRRIGRCHPFHPGGIDSPHVLR